MVEESSNPSFDVDGDGAIIQQTSSGTEDYSGVPSFDVLNVVSPSSESGGAADLITPSNQGIGSGATADRHFSSNATSLSRETTDIGGHRVKETTTVESMPNGTTIRTTETVPVDVGDAQAVRTTIHERAEASGQMTRTTLTQNPDGSRVKQIETIRPGGSKSVMMETTDAQGRKMVETAEYPPTLVSTPQEYGVELDGQTVVSELTFSRTVAPWHSPADHPSNGGSRPIDVDNMKELEGGGYYDYDGKKRQAPPPYWTLKRKLLLAAGTVLLAGVAAGAAVGIVLAGGNDDTAQQANGAGATNNTGGGDSGDDGDDGGDGDDGNNITPPGQDESDDSGDSSNPFDDLLNSSLTPASVGFEHEWPSEEGWVVAPSLAETGRPYYRPYLISDLGLCADRCAKTDAMGGAFFPRTNGEDSLCYCFVAAECIEPLMTFPAGGKIFLNKPRPNDQCDVSICGYFPEDPLCEGVEVVFDPPTPAPTVVVTEVTEIKEGGDSPSPTPLPTVDGGDEEEPSTPDNEEKTDDPTPFPSPAPTPAPSTEAPTESPTPMPSTSEPTRSPTSVPTSVPTTSEPTMQPTTAPAPCSPRPLERDVPCGLDSRFTPWDDLSNTVKTVFLSLKLGYTEETWSNPGTAPIEALRWSELNADQRLAAGSARFEQETWDCYQNHYLKYSWSELANEGVQQYYSALGFDEVSWSGNGRVDDVRGIVGDASWQKLSSQQQSNLVELCFFEANWD
eukprot:CAMPEP_0181053110 /NCGR_PEP_ID=MMETSP1070-20121207/17937_1 /TAXON_ID=265543 /ORGANISM="Minutocellus polymorphus, Strain NH13" /LENGTH=733 /DNA_ID=CAMNT_0023132225 /DNA_START=302 /DNA_END=2503 /DNA_ORIENTATION=+